ncbi:MAG: hypothetical protein JSS20_03940 [Proteobacteria bacterium]|nr:hypothetical protein [Pseudomonadota bacterium]
MQGSFSRLSPFRWTWEWLFLLVLPFAIFWHQIAASALGALDIGAIAGRGLKTEASITRISGGPSGPANESKGFLAAFRRFEFYLVDLEWLDASGARRQVKNVRVSPDAGQSIGFRAGDRKLPMKVAIKYLDGVGVPAGSSVAESEASGLPSCEPAAQCSVLVLDADGSSGFDFFTRFWLDWGNAVTGLCVAGFVAVLSMRGMGRI